MKLQGKIGTALESLGYAISITMEIRVRGQGKEKEKKKGNSRVKLPRKMVLFKYKVLEHQDLDMESLLMY